MSKINDGIPCGECEIGVYTEVAFLNKTARLFGAKEAAEREKCIPQCKHFDRRCLGATEFHKWLIDIDSRDHPPHERG